MICLPDHSCLGLMMAGGNTLILPEKSTRAPNTNCWYSPRVKNRPLSVILTAAITWSCIKPCSGVPSLGTRKFL